MQTLAFWAHIHTHTYIQSKRQISRTGGSCSSETCQREKKYTAITNTTATNKQQHYEHNTTKECKIAKSVWIRKRTQKNKCNVVRSTYRSSGKKSFEIASDWTFLVKNHRRKHNISDWTAENETELFRRNVNICDQHLWWCSTINKNRTDKINRFASSGKRYSFLTIEMVTNWIP